MFTKYEKKRPWIIAVVVLSVVVVLCLAVIAVLLLKPWDRKVPAGTPENVITSPQSSENSSTEPAVGEDYNLLMGYYYQMFTGMYPTYTLEDIVNGAMEGIAGDASRSKAYTIDNSGYMVKNDVPCEMRACVYDYNDDGIKECLIAEYNKEEQTFLIHDVWTVDESGSFVFLTYVGEIMDLEDVEWERVE